MDLAGDYAVPLPMRVIAGLIGIPDADWARFKGWSDSIQKLSHTRSGGEIAEKGMADFRARPSKWRPTSQT